MNSCFRADLNRDIAMNEFVEKSSSFVCLADSFENKCDKYKNIFIRYTV